MSVVCLGSKTPSVDQECIDVKKDYIRQAAAGMFTVHEVHVSMYVCCIQQ